jgi:hypothetical protein
MGLALFIAVGLAMFFGVGACGSGLKAGPIDPAVVAPAEQLGKAFAMAAAHVRLMAVSVYSGKVVNIQVPGFQFPFGENFFRQFFGPGFPGQPMLPQTPAPREYQGLRKDILGKAKDKDTVLLLIKRKGGSLFVVLKVK